MSTNPLDGLGLGIGWRSEIAGLVAKLDSPRFCEVVAEAVCVEHGLPRPLATLRERGVAVVPHGTRLSLGSAEPLDSARVHRFAATAAALEAPVASEHVAFVRAGGVDAGHLLPVPRTRESLDVLVRNVRAVQSELDCPLALEPIAALFDWPDDEFAECDFLTELLERTGAYLLLDVANVYANARNRGHDPSEALHRMPLERMAYGHVAGGAEHDGLYHDTHTAPTPEPVLRLVGELAALRRDAGREPTLLLERDGRYPPEHTLRAELDAIADAAGLPSPTEPFRPEPSRSKQSRPEHSRWQPSQPEHFEPEPSRSEPSQPEHTQPEPSRWQHSQPEHFPSEMFLNKQFPPEAPPATPTHSATHRTTTRSSVLDGVR